MSFDIGHLLVSIADACETAATTARAKETQQPPIPPKFSLTERVLVYMMRENTGASILDSGGTYGRAWQRNLERDFAQEGGKTGATIRGDVYRDHDGKARLDLDVTIDLFTYLASRLEYDRALTGQFRKFAALERNAHKSDYELMPRFAQWIAGKRGVKYESHGGDNSYNQDNYLSGTVQYEVFSLDSENYVLLQIHGGCDVRGGYTDPKVFRVTDDGCGTFGDWYEAQIFPDPDEVRVIRDGMKETIARQTWLTPEIEADHMGEAATLGDDVWWQIGNWEDAGEGCAQRELEKYPIAEIVSRAEWRRGVVCVLEDGTVLCPETGATLRARFCH